MQKVELIINALFMFLGKYIKGYRTIILAIATAIIGGWEWLTGSGLFEFLCSISDNFQALVVFCNVTETKFYGLLIMIVGIINLVLRKLTDTPVGETGTSNLTISKVSPFGIILGCLVFLLIVFIVLPYLFTLIANAVA